MRGEEESSVVATELDSVPQTHTRDPQTWE